MELVLTRLSVGRGLTPECTEYVRSVYLQSPVVWPCRLQITGVGARNHLLSVVHSPKFGARAEADKPQEWSTANRSDVTGRGSATFASHVLSIIVPNSLEKELSFARPIIDNLLPMTRIQYRKASQSGRKGSAMLARYHRLSRRMRTCESCATFAQPLPSPM